MISHQPRHLAVWCHHASLLFCARFNIFLVFSFVFYLIHVLFDFSLLAAAGRSSGRCRGSCCRWRAPWSRARRRSVCSLQETILNESLFRRLTLVSVITLWTISSSPDESLLKWVDEVTASILRPAADLLLFESTDKMWLCREQRQSKQRKTTTTLTSQRRSGEDIL